MQAGRPNARDATSTSFEVCEPNYFKIFFELFDLSTKRHQNVEVRAQDVPNDYVGSTTIEANLRGVSIPLSDLRVVWE